MTQIFVEESEPLKIDLRKYLKVLDRDVMIVAEKRFKKNEGP